MTVKTLYKCTWLFCWPCVNKTREEIFCFEICFGSYVPFWFIFPMHYWLRAIRGGPLGVVNFASHFICVQIYQIKNISLAPHFIGVQIFQMEISALSFILSASKYSRYNFRGWTDEFPLGACQILLCWICPSHWIAFVKTICYD